jgi:serine protease AprX
MQKTLIAIALLGALLPAQNLETYSVPGTDTQVRAIQADGKTYSSISRDAGRSWTRQGEIDTKLHIKFGTFDPRFPPMIPAALLAKAANRLFVVQFHTQIISEFRSALKGMGAELPQYLPSQSYMVRMDRTLLGKVRALPFVRCVTEFHPAFRLDTEIILNLGKAAKATRYTIVLVDKRRDAVGLETRVIGMGAMRNVPADGGVLFEATMTEAQMLQIANDDRCQWIERSSMPDHDIDQARIQGGTNYVDLVAGIRGIGMTGHIMEGIYRTHPEFGAIAGIRGAPLAPFNSSASSHGTNTAGEIYARGASPLYKGLMPNAQLVYTNYSYVINRSTRYGATKSMIANQRIMLDTASWGYARTLLYTSRSQEMDDIIFDLDLFITQSQSNAGGTSQPRNSRAQAWAKNICSVGGFRHRNNSNAADDYWGRSGSTGPANDGRIGVTLAAYYDSIRTTSGSSSYTTSFGGTSGATPIVNGLGGNMIEMFTDGLFGYTKTKAKTSAERSKVLPHFSTTKALLVATAAQVPYNSSGVSFGANRYQQGFGFPNMRRAYDERNRMLVIDELDVLRASQSRTYYVLARGGRFVAAMQYPDPPGTSASTIHRINSVDLTVKSSSGTIYRGNNGLTAGAYSTPGGGVNDRDTEETVILNAMPAGVTTVTVSCAAVRRDGHVETTSADIDYGLAVDGLRGMRDRSELGFDVTSSAPGHLAAKVTGVPSSGWSQGFTLYSLATSRPVSTGTMFGIEFDGLTSSLFSEPLAAGSPFHFTNGTSSQYPKAAFTFPMPVAVAIKGVTLDGVTFLLSGMTMVRISNVSRVTVK